MITMQWLDDKIISGDVDGEHRLVTNCYRRIIYLTLSIDMDSGFGQ